MVEALAIARAAAQVIQVSVGNRRQPLELFLAVLAKLALQNAPGSGTAESFVGLIDLGQQLDVGLGIATGKAMPVATLDPHLTGGQVAANQSRNLCPAQPRHLADVAP